MEYILYIGRFLYRIRWWLIIGTAVITLAVYNMGERLLSKNYNVEATLYTGIASGYSLEGGGDKVDWATAQNGMDNLINIIKAESTLQRVSMRLYVRSLIHGDPEKDNQYISAANYRWIYNHLKNSPQGNEILALVDKKDEEKTFHNFFKYMKPDKHNYLYGLFYYTHPHYSFGALKNIQVTRKGVSDLLQVTYSANDPGMAYNTIDILTKEFVNEYRSIRYGETDKVIEYFKAQLDSLKMALKVEEDSLTQYNIEKQVINYYDETKEIASINKEFELREQDIELEHNSTKAMLVELEKQMGNNSKQMLNNLQFVNKLKEASVLTGKISEMETVSSSKEVGSKLDNYKNRLSTSRKELSKLADKYIEDKYTKEGVSRNNIIEQWLDLTLRYEKAKSDLIIVQQSRKALATKYKNFAPVGSTIKRKERGINFTEQNYSSVQKSYNDALMRKKNLEMTSATLKVLNPPAYPISPAPNGLSKITMAVCAGTFLFILGFFMILELLDRTLRDSIRSRRLTGLPLLGAFPSGSTLQYRGYVNECKKIATKQLSSNILHFCTESKPGLPYIVNFISTESKSGKSHVIGYLEEYWNSIGLKVRKLTWDVDFQTNSRTYLLAKSITDLYTPEKEDILIVEYPDMRGAGIPSELLKEANLNVLQANADRGWKETDKILAEKLQKQVADAPLYLYLNQASREVVEGYTGMLPPYTFIRKLSYRLSQLALTENMMSVKRSKKHQIASEEDD